MSSYILAGRHNGTIFLKSESAIVRLIDFKTHWMVLNPTQKDYGTSVAYTTYIAFGDNVSTNVTFPFLDLRYLGLLRYSIYMTEKAMYVRKLLAV